MGKGFVYLVTWAVIWSFWPDLGEGFDRLGLMLVAAGLLEGDSVKRAQRLGVRRDDSRPDGLEADYRNLLKPSK